MADLNKSRKRLPKPASDTTIAEAKEYLRQHCVKGTHCPVCQRTVKVISRKINSSMAMWLVELYCYTQHHRPADGWVHAVQALSNQQREHSKLRYWGLVEEKPGKRGFWRITSKGCDFVLGQVQVPRACCVLHNRPFMWSVELTDIRRALKDKFDLAEAMMQPCRRRQA